MITALQAETMCLSLHLGGEALHYEVYQRMDFVGTDCLLSGSLAYDPQLRLMEAISEALYSTPQLTLPYGKVCLHYTPRYVQLLPEELFSPDALSLSSYEAVAGEVLSPLPYPLRDVGQVLIGSLGAELVQFFARQYLNVEYIPSYVQHFAPLVEEARLSGRGQMLIYLDARGLSLAVLTERHVAFLNRYEYVSPWQAESKQGEVLYYLSLVVEALSLDYEGLSLHILADEETEAPLTAQLHELLCSE